MDKVLKYKGYIGSVDVSVEDDCLHGKVLFINDLVTYEAKSPKDLEDEFNSAVEDYLDTCNELGKVPDKPFSGSFNVRIDPGLHRKIAIEAKYQDISLNELVKKALEDKFSDDSLVKHHHIHKHIITERTGSFSVEQGVNEWQIEENAILHH